MAKQNRKSFSLAPEQIHWGPDVPMKVIRNFARAVGNILTKSSFLARMLMVRQTKTVTSRGDASAQQA
jgi:hypothetical protein